MNTCSPANTPKNCNKIRRIEKRRLFSKVGNGFFMNISRSTSFAVISSNVVLFAGETHIHVILMKGCCQCVSEPLLFQAHMSEDGPQCEVVGRFEHSGQDERQPNDEQGSLKQQAGENRAGC